MTNIFEPGANRCGIPDIPPIEDLPFIDDCSVPAPPAVISDCPDIDIPVALPGADGAGGVPGPPGPPGADGVDGTPGLPGLDGDDGVDGCDPVITATVTTVIVDDPGEVTVTVNVTEISHCHYRLDFIFYLLGTSVEQCCQYIWCCTGEIPESSCCSGDWLTYKGTGCSTPCQDGCCNGEIMIVCPCPASSSSGGHTCNQCSPGVTGTPGSYMLDLDGVFNADCSDCAAAFNGATFVLTQDSGNPCRWSYSGAGACGNTVITLTISAGVATLVVVDLTAGGIVMRSGEGMLCSNPNPLFWESSTSGQCNFIFATASLTAGG